MVQIKQPPAEDRCWHDTDGVGDGEGDQHLDVLGEHVVDGDAHCSSRLSLVNNQPSCYDTVSDKDNQEIAKDIYNHAIAGMVTVSVRNIAAIHGVCPLIYTGDTKDITRN